VRSGAQATTGGDTEADAERVPLGVIAVAPGDGLADALAAFGVADERLHVTVVRGGQAENPSAGEILAAILESPGEEIVILPNNPNVKLAAGQAAEMADRPVRVVPTRNVAEGSRRCSKSTRPSARAGMPRYCWRPAGRCERCW